VFNQNNAMKQIQNKEKYTSNFFSQFAKWCRNSFANNSQRSKLWHRTVFWVATRMLCENLLFFEPLVCQRQLNLSIRPMQTNINQHNRAVLSWFGLLTVTDLYYPRDQCRSIYQPTQPCRFIMIWPANGDGLVLSERPV
jgi:hypothetical protein